MLLLQAARLSRICNLFQKGHQLDVDRPMRNGMAPYQLIKDFRPTVRRQLFNPGCGQWKNTLCVSPQSIAFCWRTQQPAGISFAVSYPYTPSCYIDHGGGVSWIAL